MLFKARVGMGFRIIRRTIVLENSVFVNNNTIYKIRSTLSRVLSVENYGEFQKTLLAFAWEVAGVAEPMGPREAGMALASPLLL